MATDLQVKALNAHGEALSNQFDATLSSQAAGTSFTLTGYWDPGFSSANAAPAPKPIQLQFGAVDGFTITVTYDMAVQSTNFANGVTLRRWKAWQFVDYVPVTAIKRAGDMIVDYTLSQPWTEATVFEFKYDAGAGDVSRLDNPLAELQTFDEAVENVYVDVVAPTYVDGSLDWPVTDIVLLNFSEDVISPTQDYVTGVTINIDASPATILSGATVIGSNRLEITLSAPIVEGEVVTVSYNDTLGDLTDVAGTPNALASFTDQPVANNSVNTLYTGLVHYWPLNEASGNALDKHGTLNLTSFNGVSAGATAAPDGGQCRLLDGLTQYLRAENVTDTPFAHGHSAVMWFKDLSTPEFQPVVTIYTLLSQMRTDLANKFGWRMGILSQPTSYVTYINASEDGVAFGYSESFIPMNHGPWNMLTFHHRDSSVITRNKNSGNNKNRTYAGSISDVGDSSPNVLDLGVMDSFGTPQDFFNGYVWAFGYWTRELTTDERGWLYNSGNGRLLYT